MIDSAITLVVDEEQMFRKMIADVLMDDDQNILTASDGREAMQQPRSSRVPAPSARGRLRSAFLDALSILG